MTLTFALAEPRARLDSDDRHDDAEEKHAHVLVVEDEEPISTALHLFLSDEGFEVTIAADGAAATRLLETQAFDAMVLDLGLPDMDGADVLLRAQNLAPSLPVVVTSGHGSAARVASDGLGLVEQLPKPYELAELIQLVQRLLERRHSVARIAV